MTCYFKYLEPDRCDVLENGSLRFTPFAELNDPFEAAPCATPPSEEHLRADFRERLRVDARNQSPTATDEEIEQVIAQRHEANFPRYLKEIKNEHHWDAFPERMQKKVSEEWGTLCLSKVEDNLLMWSHYCKGHTGFVVGFDRSHYQFRDARSVHYHKLRPTLKLQEPKPHGEDWYLTKSPDWTYEDEVRLFMKLTDCNVIRERPNSTPVHLLIFDPKSVLSITVGWRAPSDLKATLTRLVHTSRYPNARLRIARPHRHEHKMAIENFPP
jgi:hypothetical protein